MNIFKKNKGITIIDLTISFIAISIFTAVISLFFLRIIKINRAINFDSVTMSYMVQILEGIDICDFEEVTEENAENIIAQYNIPERYNVDIEVTNYNDSEYIKIVTVTMSYNVSGDTEEISIKRLKIVEA